MLLRVLHMCWDKFEVERRIFFMEKLEILTNKENFEAWASKESEPDTLESWYYEIGSEYEEVLFNREEEGEVGEHPNHRAIRIRPQLEVKSNSMVSLGEIHTAARELTTSLRNEKKEWGENVAIKLPSRFGASLLWMTLCDCLGLISGEALSANVIHAYLSLLVDGSRPSDSLRGTITTLRSDASMETALIMIGRLAKSQRSTRILWPIKIYDKYWTLLAIDVPGNDETKLEIYLFRLLNAKLGAEMRSYSMEEDRYVRDTQRHLEGSNYTIKAYDSTTIHQVNTWGETSVALLQHSKILALGMIPARAETKRFTRDRELILYELTSGTIILPQYLQE